MREMPVYETIVVRETDSCGFIAGVCDAKNKSTVYFRIEGSSLYDAYYNYMVENGYFSEVGQKIGSIARNRG